MATATQESRPRRWRLQFSLRLLLIAMLAFAVGFPIWYRWPYVEAVVHDHSGDPLSAVKELRQSTTWQRQWGGGRLKHGTERTLWDGKLVSIETYRQGVQHGPDQSFYIGLEKLAEAGQYANGEKDGVWTAYHENGSVRSTTTWRRGQLDGPATIFGKRLLYAAGRIVEVNGRPVEDLLASFDAAGKADSVALVEALKYETGLHCIDIPLQSVVQTLSQVIRVPIVIDPLHVDPETRVNCNGIDVPFSTALTIMAAEHGLGCDYRYGCIWITSTEDANDWHDPTGVAEIAPREGSVLAGVWSEPVSIAANNQPAAAALTQICQPLGVRIDTSQLKSGDGSANPPVTHAVNGLPFRHVLGALLYKAGCRCKLDEDTLVILPPDTAVDDEE